MTWLSRPAWLVAALRFAAVGGLGFLIDAGTMSLLGALAGIPPLWARSISFPLALTATWLINRNWTFQHGRTRSARSQYAIYLGVQLIGLSINFGIFAALVTTSSDWADRPVLALAVGAVASLVVTFALSQTIAFARPRHSRPGSDT